MQQQFFRPAALMAVGVMCIWAVWSFPAALAYQTDTPSQENILDSIGLAPQATLKILYIAETQGELFPCPT